MLEYSDMKEAAASLSTLPCELIIKIIGHCAVGNQRDADTIESISRVCKPLFALMYTHSKDIVDAFTIATDHEKYILYSYCGITHRGHDMPAIIHKNNTITEWYWHSKRHRAGDKPALIGSCDRQVWYYDGQCHREGDKPAVICANGTQYWIKEGRIHRENDLPAVIWADALYPGGAVTQAWYHMGERHRGDDNPAVIRADGSSEWWRFNSLHRTCGPACITADGSSEWWRFNSLHRTCGPACITADGSSEYYVSGARVIPPEK